MTDTNENQEFNLIVTLEGRDITLMQDAYGVNMDSTEREILDAVRATVGEVLQDDEGQYSFAVRKAVNSGKIYVYPKPVAGTDPDPEPNLIITLDGQDMTLMQDAYGIDMDSTERQILDAIRPAVGEVLADDEGEYSFAVRKAVNSGKIYVYPKPVAGADPVIQEWSDSKRLQVYKILTSACTHLYSKGKLQMDKFKEVSKIFADLAKHDPYFMAHYAAYVAKSDSKDQKVLAVFWNALNDADGQPFFKGSTANKPNLRQVSGAILQQIDPHLACRVMELCLLKFGVPGILNESRHFPNSLRNAFVKYLRYREENIEMLRGARRSGMAGVLRSMYRYARIAPSDSAAAALKWGKQKDGRRITEEELPNFNGLDSAAIAEKLLNDKISPVVACTIIPKNKMSAGVAKALLTNCTGNQAIVLYRMFSRNGYLEVKSIKELFAEKVKTSTTAVDRIDILTKDAAEEDKKEFAEIRSDSRKKATRDIQIGKLFLSIDKSGSMEKVLEYAKECGSIFAECLNDPAHNFGWGLFDTAAYVLPTPSKFTKEAFYQALYGRAAGGSTDCIALYQKAREFGAEVDVYLTDQGHYAGAIMKRLNDYHDRHPSIPKPKAAIIVHFRNDSVPNTSLEDGLRAVGIPVTVVTPESLKESALVAQSVRTALVGELAIIDNIMETPLPSLPRWWNEISLDPVKSEPAPVIEPVKVKKTRKPRKKANVNS